MTWILRRITRGGMEHHQKFLNDGTRLNIYAYPSTKPRKSNGTLPQDCQIEIVRPGREVLSRGRYEGIAYSKRLAMKWYREVVEAGEVGRPISEDRMVK